MIEEVYIRCYYIVFIMLLLLFVPSPTDTRNTGAGPRPAADWYTHVQS